MCDRGETEIRLPNVRRQIASVVGEGKFGDDSSGFLLLPPLARRRIPQPDCLVFCVMLRSTLAGYKGKSPAFDQPA
jgi:hypothetical protein